MIQRIQTLWLLFAGLTGLLAWKLDFWKSAYKDGTFRALAVNTGSSTTGLVLYITILAVIALAWITIFLFKKRKLQTRLSLLGILLSIGTLILEYEVTVAEKAVPAYNSGSWQLGIVLPLVIAFFFFLAIRGIRKDERLVKSLNRLR